MNSLLPPGASAILNYDDIAIRVLMVVVLMQAGLIWYLLRQHFSTVEDAKKTFEEVQRTLTILAERIGRHQ